MNEEEKLQFIRETLENFKEHSYDTMYCANYISEIDNEMIDEYIKFYKEYLQSS